MLMRRVMERWINLRFILFPSVTNTVVLTIGYHSSIFLSDESFLSQHPVIS